MNRFSKYLVNQNWRNRTSKTGVCPRPIGSSPGFITTRTNATIEDMHNLRNLKTEANIFSQKVKTNLLNGELSHYQWSPPQSVPPDQVRQPWMVSPDHARLPRLVQGDHLRHLASPQLVPHSHGWSPTTGPFTGVAASVATVNIHDIVRVLNSGTHSHTRVYMSCRSYIAASRLFSLGTSVPE